MLPAEAIIEKLPPIWLPACCYTLVVQPHDHGFARRDATSGLTVLILPLTGCSCQNRSTVPRARPRRRAANLSPSSCTCPTPCARTWHRSPLSRLFLPISLPEYLEGSQSTSTLVIQGAFLVWFQTCQANLVLAEAKVAQIFRITSLTSYCNVC